MSSKAGHILFASMTGHSRKIANEIARSTGMLAQDVKAQPELPPCDVLFIVSGVYGGKQKPELIEYLQKITPKAFGRVVLISSSARGLAQGDLRRVLEEAGFTVEKEEFLCRGGFLFMSIGHPDRQEIAAAINFAEMQLKKQTKQG